MKNPYDLQLYNWHLEISSKCALKCPRCLRTEAPNSFTPKELSLDFIRRVFSKNLLQNQVKRITFSGGLGDPIYNSQFLEILSYLKETNPKVQIVTITNGSYKDTDWWKQFANITNAFDEVIFSVDGWDQASNNLYRKNSHWNSITEGIRTVAEHGDAIIRWSTIVFKFNEDKIERISETAENLGADAFSITLSDRFGTIYPNYIDSNLGIDPLEPDLAFITKNYQTKRLKRKFETGKWRRHYPVYKDIDAIEAERKSKVEQDYAQKQVVPSCLFGYRGSYIDVDGFYYPCSWIAHIYE